MHRFLVLSAALLLSFAAVPVHAQQGTAQISGRITDEQGAMLPGVSIAITNEATGVSREVTSSAEGAYSASQLVPGTYRVVAQTRRVP